MLPWADWSEWLELKTMLTNGDYDAARDRVAIYQMRRRAAVPITVVTSVALSSQLKNPSTDPYTQRLSLAMSITRFVNGMTDRLQPRAQGSFSRSVYSLAVELQLPLILVEIRHQSSHNTLPRLTTLESGARQALQWLEQFYWEPQQKNVEEQLENDLSRLGSIFANGSSGGAEDPSMSLLRAENGEGRGDANGKNLNSALESLQSLSERVSERIEKRETMQKPQPALAGSKRKSWTMCDDREAWKPLPLGLAPGQTKVPRISYQPKLEPHAHPAISNLVPPRNTECNGINEAGRLSAQDVSGRKALSAGETAYVEGLVSHYKNLITPQDRKSPRRPKPT